MAEVIAALGVAASVAQLADYGFKLSIKLFSYSQAVSQADASIKGISNDVSLTSIVLQELCKILKSDESHIASSSAVEATQQTVKECLQIFEELSRALDKSLGTLGFAEKGKVKKGRVALEKLKWPFKQPKMELLRSNLDRLKASLTLMLQVLSYARSISSQKERESSFEYQKHLIEGLARSERTTRRKYHELQRAIDSKYTDQDFDVAIITSAAAQSKGLDFETLENKTPSEVKPKVLIGELLLCFRLLNELLRAHLDVSTATEGSTVYKEFKSHLEKLNKTELQRLEKEHGDTSTADAARKLQARLGELANGSGSSTKNKMVVIGTNGQIEQPRESMESSRPAIFYALEEGHNTGRIRDPTSGDNNTIYRTMTGVQDDERVGVPKARRLIYWKKLEAQKLDTQTVEQPRKRLWSRAVDNITRETTTSSPASPKTSPLSGKPGDLATKGRGSLFSSEDEDMPENVVQSLLSEWTTLPS